jgi:drug/metabolite transporter (DMT)-like permease
MPRTSRIRRIAARPASDPGTYSSRPVTTITTDRPALARAPLVGVLLCVGSAAGFGAMGIFGTLAYDAGVGVMALLVARFVLATLILAVIQGVRRPALPRGRMLVAAILLGAIGYAAQATLYFLSIERIDPGLTALLLYIFPALVTLGAVALGRDRLDAVRVLALLLAFAGLVLIVLIGGPGELDALGVAFALCSALVYSVYVLAADSVLVGLEPLSLSTVVCAGAMLTFGVAAGVSGELSLDFDAIGWLWLAGIAVISTVIGIVLFFAGLERVGPSRASIISTVEPLVTVVLAFVIFGDALSVTQLLGGALVLASVVLLQTLGQGPEPPGP